MDGRCDLRGFKSVQTQLQSHGSVNALAWPCLCSYPPRDCSRTPGDIGSRWPSATLRVFSTFRRVDLGLKAPAQLPRDAAAVTTPNSSFVGSRRELQRRMAAVLREGSMRMCAL